MARGLLWIGQVLVIGSGPTSRYATSVLAQEGLCLDVARFETVKPSNFRLGVRNLFGTVEMFMRLPFCFDRQHIDKSLVTSVLR